MQTQVRIVMGLFRKDKQLTVAFADSPDAAKLKESGFVEVERQDVMFKPISLEDD